MKSSKTSNETNHQGVNSNGVTHTSSSVNRLRKNKVMINNDYCSFCDEGGDLLSCDRCPASFHLLCHDPPLGFDQIPKGDFLCNKCKIISSLNEKKSSQNITTDLNSTQLTNDTKTIKFETEENEPVLETLIRIAKSLNPRQMQLSQDLNVECAFDLPGLNKIKWWTKDGNKIINVTRNSTNGNSNSSSDHNGLSSGKNPDINRFKGSNEDKETFKSNNSNEYSNGNNDSSLNQIDLCFICSKLAKDKTNSIKCDFCPLKFHLDCLNVPLCSMPSRERLWMCPNHLENFLDQYLVKSSRLSERISMWKEYTFSRAELNAIKTDFIKKCSKTHQKSTIKRCQIPKSIKNAYSKSTCHVYTQSQTNSEDEAYLSAIEALTLLSNPNKNGLTNHKEENTNKSIRKYILNPPPLHKLNSDAIKPRALLVPISNNTLTESKKNEILKLYHANHVDKLNYDLNDFEQPFLMKYRYFTIGSASNQNVPLAKCNNVSDKHACIYYDEQSGHYELLNYSEHGTLVDNCVYGYMHLNNSDDSDTDLEINSNKMSSKRIQTLNNLKCKCSYLDFNKLTSFWEGAAVLNHGSHIRIGCLNFLFIVIESSYDYAANKVNATNEPLVNVRKFTPVNKSILYSIKKQEMDMWKEKSKKLKKFNGMISSKSKLLNKLNRKSIRSNNEKLEGFIKLMNNKRKKRLLNSIEST